MPQLPTCAPGLLAASGDKGARRHISHHIPLILLLLLLLVLCCRLLSWERLWLLM
jgi:hypothetical protein